MSEEWLEIAWINFAKAILHGRVTAGRDSYGVRIEREIEQVLTEEQVGEVQDLNAKHERAMSRLLRSFVTEPAA